MRTLFQPLLAMDFAIPSDSPTDVVMPGSGRDYIPSYPTETRSLSNDDDNHFSYGNARILGNGGNDLLTDFGGNSILEGGIGDDLLTAFNGSNSLYGGTQNDILVSGRGDDFMHGGSGSDTASFKHAQTAVRVDLRAGTASGDGDDTLISIEGVHGSRYDDTLRGDDANNSILAREGDDKIYGYGGDDYLSAHAGDDTIDGGDGDDVLRGDLGDDFIRGGRGDDDIRGEAGIDTVSYTDSKTGMAVSLSGGSYGGDLGNDTITGVENLNGSYYSDILSGDHGANEIRAFGGNDHVYGNGGNDTIDAGSGSDTVEGGTGHDDIYGGSSADVIEGETGNDALDGGSGDDTLDGGIGHDTLKGGSGADTFVFRASTIDGKASSPFNSDNDRILDFDVAEGDKIDLSGHYGINNFADVMEHASNVDGRVNLILSISDLILIDDMSTSDLSADMFVF